MSELHGMAGTPTYRAWAAAKYRCHLSTNQGYRDYGARGIRMCARWRNSFAAFFADMGEKPANTSLDRIDNNGNYEPGNCRWATPEEQAANTRRTVRLSLPDGRVVIESDLARMIGVSRQRIDQVRRRPNFQAWLASKLQQVAA